MMFSDPELQQFMFIFVIYGIMAIAFCAFGLTSYLLKGFGMYGMSKKLGVPNSWMAFVPIVSSYLQGELAGEISIGKKTIKKPGVWFLVGPLLLAFVLGVTYAIAVVSLFIPVLTSNFNSNDFAPQIDPKMLIPFIIFFIIFILIAIIGQAALYAYIGMVRYHIHKKYRDDSISIVHMLLGIFVPLYQSIFFFNLRNKEPINPIVKAESPKYYIEKIEEMDNKPDTGEPDKIEPMGE